VMQPVVLDNGWPTTHAAPTNSSSAACLSDDVTLVSRAAVTASLSSSAVNGADMVDSQSQNITRASFNTLNQVDMCSVQPLAERTTDTSTTAVANQPMMKTSANTPKPPKRPLTPYMRFSQAVSCCASIFVIFTNLQIMKACVLGLPIYFVTHMLTQLLSL